MKNDPGDGPQSISPPVAIADDVTLSEEERAELVASLEEARAQIAAGDFVAHDPATFVDHMMKQRAERRRAKRA